MRSRILSLAALGCLLLFASLAFATDPLPIGPIGVPPSSAHEWGQMQLKGQTVWGWRLKRPIVLLETGPAKLGTTPTALPLKPPAQGRIFDGSLRKKILLSVVKHRTIAKLMKEGTGKAGSKPMSRTEAEAAYEKLSDEVIAGAIDEASPEASAQVAAVGGPLTNFLDWLSTHSDQIMKIVELIIKILALFG